MGVFFTAKWNQTLICRTYIQCQILHVGDLDNADNVILIIKRVGNKTPTISSVPVCP